MSMLLEKPALGSSRVKLRPYQEEAIAASRAEFVAGRKSTLIVLPTGTGKTIVFGSIARRAVEKGGRVLVLAHREELIEQAVNKLDMLGVEVGVEKAESRARAIFDPDVVIATVQTMQRKRLESWAPDHFRLIVTDECFPAGTLIDGRPIEEIRAGDEVTSFNETAWLAESRPVVRLFRKRPSGLVRVHLDDGTSLVCTPEHPVFTYSTDLIPCYVAAKDLAAYNMVYAITPLRRGPRDAYRAEELRRLRGHVHSPELEQHDDSALLGALQGEASGGAVEESHAPLCRMQDAGPVLGAGRVGAGAEGPGLLLRDVPGSVRLSPFLGANGRDESGACLRTDDPQEPDARPGRQGQDADDASGDGMETACARRERTRSHARSEATGVHSRMADGTHREDRHVGARGDRASVTLQTRHREPDSDDRDRGGRRIALRGGTTLARPEEGGLSPVARVVRVEVLEPGSDGRFGGLCPDGFVYNVEVEGNHNYFANGLLVHNCHHATAESYRRIYKHFASALHLGVTATADRADEDSLGDVFQSVAYELSLWDAMTAEAPGPYLCRLRFVQCNVEIDLRDIRTTAGDFNQADLEAKIRPLIDTLANAIRQEIGDRKTLVFTPDVGSAQAMATALASLGLAAEWVSGDDRDRKSKVERLHSGDIRVLCNCALLTEGFDCLDSETEVLTATRGWKGRDEISPDDWVYSLNRATGKLETTPITRKVERCLAPDERMVTIRSQHVNIRTTEGHEFHIKYRDPSKGGALSDNFLTRSAAQMVERRSAYALPVSATCEVEAPGLDVSDDVLRFAAWFMTDGGFERSSLAINQAPGIHADEIRELLGRLGLDFRERLRTGPTNYSAARELIEFSIPKGTHSGSMERSGWSKYESVLNKNVATALHLMDRRQFRLFWDELLKGDGSNQDGKSGWLWSDRIEQVDAYTRMAVTRGFAVSYAPETTKSGGLVYRISIRDTQWLTSDPADPRSARIEFDEPLPGEKVWCVTNPNSTLITRRRGKIAIIGNCPDISAIALCRPTKSRPFYAQMAGRGTRLAPDKTDCLLIDFNYLTAKHDLVKPVELFDTTGTDSEILEIADEWARANPRADLMEAIGQARVEKQRRAVMRIKARERSVSYRRVSYDPLSVFDTMGIPWRGNKDAVIHRASARQAEILGKFGVANAPNLSKTRASTLLDYLFHRSKAGLATMKQVSWAIAKGCDPEVARKMTKGEATAYLDQVFNKGA